MRSATRSGVVVLLAGSLSWAAEFTGKVVGVTDGDTVSVMHADKAEEVRLWGIDAPESNQAFGTKAKQAASTLCFGKVVTVTVKDTDRYGRTVGDVVLPDGKRLSRELILAGMGWWYNKYAPKDSELQRAEEEAQKKKRGLWADKAPVPPWEFRSSKRKKAP